MKNFTINRREVSFDKQAIKDLKNNKFTSANKINRFASSLIAEIKCSLYVFWSNNVTNGETVLIGKNGLNEKVFIGTGVKSLSNDRVLIKRLFWIDLKNNS